MAVRQPRSTAHSAIETASTATGTGLQTTPGTVAPRRPAARWARALAALTLALVAFSTTLASPADAASGRVYRIAPNGRAGASGASWATAGTLADLPKYIKRANPGDEVWIRGDAGVYRTRGGISIAAGGSKAAPVIVRGVAADGSSRARPTFVGTRTSPYRRNGNPGTELFKLLAGADNLEFRNLGFRNQGNGAFRVGGDISNLTITNMRASNVRRFFESYPSRGARTATVRGLRVSNVRVSGFSRGVIRLQDNTNDVVIRNVIGDSKRQDGDNFAMGIHLIDTVHDVLIQRVTMRNAHDTTNRYWNGDGFATERGTRDITFVDTVATGNTDAGYDLKSASTKLIRAVANGNKRNYRFWVDAEMIDSVGRNPLKRGGMGSQAQVWAGKTARVHIVNSRFADHRANTFVFAVEGNARVTIENVKVSKARAAREAVVEKGARLRRL